MPIRGNLIVLGNRSTNKTMSALHDGTSAWSISSTRGRKGYVIRSVHNPFGDRHSVVIVGGSDEAGVDEGAKAFVDILSKAAAAQGRALDRLDDGDAAGQGVKPPTDIREFETREASKGDRSIGYFSWCSISKRMAMYYMTGDVFSARESGRLAFPLALHRSAPE